MRVSQSALVPTHDRQAYDRQAYDGQAHDGQAHSTRPTNTKHASDKHTTDKQAHVRQATSGQATSGHAHDSQHTRAKSHGPDNVVRQIRQILVAQLRVAFSEFAFPQYLSWEQNERTIPTAAIAQLGERQTEDLKVPGSIPGLGITLLLSRVSCCVLAPCFVYVFMA